MAFRYEKMRNFLSDLGELSHKYRIGICGEPVLFVTEDIDISRQYRADSESCLHFD